MQLIKPATILLLTLVLLFGQLTVFAQRPPTAGPNPPEPTNLTPLIIAGGGVALGAASYLYLRHRGPKIAIQDHLPAYLLSRNILPTQDAIDLMYELNPRLGNREIMRSRQKLVDPVFPELPAELQISGTVPVPIMGTMFAALEEQIERFQFIFPVFQSTDLNLPSLEERVQKNQIQTRLTEVNNLIGGMGAESSSVKIQSLKDLFQILNRTLDKIIETSELGEDDLVLMMEISEDISELLSPFTPDAEVGGIGGIPQNPSYDKKAVFFASLGQPERIVDHFYEKEIPHKGVAHTWTGENMNLEQGFAFAIYKMDANGIPVTQGPEVEGKYFIKFVSPALKGFPDSYHTLPDLATYASAYFPPAKYFFVVEDINGKQMKLVHHVVDFKRAFTNPQRKKINEMIVVILRISND